MISIEAASEIDIPTIQAIANITWPNTFRPLMSEQKLNYMMDMMYSTEALAHQMKEEHHHYLLIYFENKAVGYSSYELNYRGDSQIMMHKLYVLPSVQRKGIGRLVIDHLSEIGKEHQQNSLRLQVLHTNEKAMAFYERLGFHKAGQEPKVLSKELGSFTDNVMVKDL